MCCGLTGAGYGCAQESEGEEAAESRVTLAQDMGKGNVAARQSRIKLQEVRTARAIEAIYGTVALVAGHVAAPEGLWMCCRLTCRHIVVAR